MSKQDIVESRATDEWRGRAAHLDWKIVERAHGQLTSRLPLIAGHVAERVAPGFDAWDMWPIAHPDGRTVDFDGRHYWLFLASEEMPDPEDRHDCARIRLTSVGSGGWRDHGWAFPDSWSPGDREWSGCALLEADERTVTMYFTATGRKGQPRTFEQRIFETSGELSIVDGAPALSNWSDPVEAFVADGRWYKVADQTESAPHGIWGFRDPSYFQDPADGAEYLLFTGSAGWTLDLLDGVIGIASRSNGRWNLQPPLIEAIGVGSELERPHIVMRDGRYYCFWSSHGRKFAPDLRAPTGLYGMTAEHVAGPWRPLNGSGLVAANPLTAPFQAYCWWVTGEGEVFSFLDYPGARGTTPPLQPERRRAIFGGTVAPTFTLTFDGDTVLPAPVNPSA